MKKIFTLAIILAATCFTLPSQAQVKFGLKGGLNVTNMSFSNDVFNTSNQTGFFVGPTLKFTLPIVGLGIDASALYDQRQAKIEGSDDKLKQQSINVPINLRYDIGLSSLAAIYLAAGPQFGFNIGDDENIIDQVGSWKLSSSNFSVNVGAGLMLLSHLQIGANYNIVCGKTGEMEPISGAINGVTNIIKGRSNSWQISATYYF